MLRRKKNSFPRHADFLPSYFANLRALKPSTSVRYVLLTVNYVSTRHTTHDTL